MGLRTFVRDERVERIRSVEVLNLQGSRQASFNETVPEKQLSRNHYEQRLASIQSVMQRLEELSSRLNWARPLLFLAAAGLLAAGYTQAGAPVGTVWIGWLLFASFVFVLVWHESIRLRLESLATSRNLFHRLLARLDRRWSEMPMIPFTFSEPATNTGAARGLAFSITAEDLDVFGARSLFQWMCLAGTTIGRQRLAQWLATWVDQKTIEDRQQAVREFASQRELREQILFQSTMLSGTHASPENFTSWASGGSWLEQHRIARGLSYLGPLLFWIGVTTLLMAKWSENTNLQWTGLAIGIIGLLVNIGVLLGRVGAIHDIFQRINTGHDEVSAYQELYQAIANIHGEGEWIRARRAVCCEGPDSAIAGFKQLSRLIRLANLQRNHLFYIPYLLLQFTLMLDFRVLSLLERWQRRFGSASSKWLDALADWEAIASAATIADENPDWGTPQWTDSSMLLEIRAMGHPLIPDPNRVINDVDIPQDRRLLLVTGSNMAGKSTLLRSIGLNLILARTGAPMCCTSYRGQVFDLATSIRVQDSLQDGVSFFMAELFRLRDVVQAAKQFRERDQRPVMVLLDEILQGTNSRERQIAVIEVVKQLLQHQAVTWISTHDLELADQSSLLEAGQVVHFREYFEKVDGAEKMKFDYRMRPGPTPTTNALKLLELVGLRTEQN